MDERSSQENQQADGGILVLVQTSLGSLFRTDEEEELDEGEGQLVLFILISCVCGFMRKRGNHRESSTTFGRTNTDRRLPCSTDMIPLSPQQTSGNHSVASPPSRGRTRYERSPGTGGAISLTAVVRQATVQRITHKVRSVVRNQEEGEDSDEDPEQILLEEIEILVLEDAEGDGGDSDIDGEDTKNLFPDERNGSVDADILRKLGMTNEMMENVDTLFFFQLLLPICNPSQSGVEDDPRKSYYTKGAIFHKCI